MTLHWRYVGMDVFKQMIRFLKANVDRRNFRYHHVPFKNAMYNPDGVELTAAASFRDS